MTHTAHLRPVHTLCSMVVKPQPLLSVRIRLSASVQTRYIRDYEGYFPMLRV